MRLSFPFLFLLLFLSGSHTLPAAAAANTVVFMSDFGTVDDSVAICKGVIVSINPDARIIDLTHEVTPFSILDGARFLAGTAPYYPAGTVFLVVIDPGVGSPRKPIVVKSKKAQYFVLPDNGLITLVEQQDGIETAREITNNSWMIGRALSSTFHGRDIFSPVAAHLAGRKEWTTVGPIVNQLVRIDVAPTVINGEGIEGQIIGLDGPYGNLISNIEADLFLKLGYKQGEKISIVIDEKKQVIPFVKTFSDVAAGQPLVYIDSRGRVGIAINKGNFAATFQVKPPVHIFIPRKK